MKNQSRNYTFGCIVVILITFVCIHQAVSQSQGIPNSPKTASNDQTQISSQLTMTNVYSPPDFASLRPRNSLAPAPFFRVLHDNVIVRLAPSRQTRRRGVVMKNTVLPIHGAAKGPGCGAPWYHVYQDGWICGELGKIVSDGPQGNRFPQLPNESIMPWPYAFVHRDTIEYRFKEGFLQEERDTLKGFGFGVAGSVTYNGEEFFKTASGNYIPKEDAHITHNISPFVGIKVEEKGAWPVGFVNKSRAVAYRGPKRAKGSSIGVVHRFWPFAVLEVKGTGNRAMFRFDTNAWLSARDVRVARMATLPKGLAPGEKWIDVDTKTQIVTAYEGEKPVYATMASTGRKGPSRTVTGTFRIWVKVAAIAMDNTDEQEEEVDYLPYTRDGNIAFEKRLYSLQDVPWAQFFYQSYALHGVYWHNRFGNRKSHGCVNLAPQDAKWFFDWTAPTLPGGFWALHSTPNDKGTLVRVR